MDGPRGPRHHRRVIGTLTTTLPRPLRHQSALAARGFCALLVALCVLSGCSTGGGGGLDAPVAALRHPEVVRVGEQVTLDATASAFDAATRFADVRFRFRVADGSAEVETDAAAWTTTFGTAGEFGVSVEVVGSDGQSSSATSSITVVADYTPICPNGDAAAAGCASGDCAGDVCAVLACAGADACPASGGLACVDGYCLPAETSGGSYVPGPDAGARGFDGGG